MPWGTLTVNLLGSLVLGLLTGLAAHRDVPVEVILALGTGLCGAMTTYSTFSYETLRLAQLGDWRAACLNVAGTTVLCLALCAAGIALGRVLTR